MNQLMKTRDKLKEIENGVEPEFKNSVSYIGKDWRKAEECDVYPVQRKLTPRECVFDLDSISASQMIGISNWLKDIDFKFEAWLSSKTGLHIHYWSEITGLNRKKILTEVLSEKIKEKFGIQNDIGPMETGMIRTEWAKHPRKGTQKILFSSNMGTLFPLNEINANVKQKVSDLGLLSPNSGMSNSGLSHGRCRTCMKYILDNTFTDCRKRLMFTVASHYIAIGLTKPEAVDKTWEWSEKQGGISRNEVWASCHSSSGRVGCHGRHKLLEEMGVEMEGKCQWER